MSSYNNSNDNNSQQPKQDKNHLGYDDNDVASKIEQVKANRAAKGKHVKSTSDPSSDSSIDNANKKIRSVESVLGDATKNRMMAKSYDNTKSIETSQTPIVQLSEPITVAPSAAPQSQILVEKEKDTKKDNEDNNSSNKNVKYWQNKIRENYVSIQGTRTLEIQKLVSKDKHIIYQFIDSNTPPKIGQKPNKKEHLVPIEVYYNEIENWRHLDWQKQRAEIAHLNKIKTDSNPQTDDDGITIPAKITANDQSQTGITDEQFLKLDSIIHEKETALYKEIALWMFGIDAELYDHLDRTSLYAALEAGQIREIFGLVDTSKNSTDYLT